MIKDLNYFDWAYVPKAIMQTMESLNYFNRRSVTGAQKSYVNPHYVTEKNI